MAAAEMFVICILTILSVLLPSSLASANVQSLHITSDIKYRFATTLVSSVVRNTGWMSQEAVFDVTLPNRAFITTFTLEIEGTVYPGNIKEKEEAKQQYVAAKQRGESAALISERPRETNKFNVEVNVAPSSSVSFNLTYQELLQRKHGQYEHVIYINPGQPVEDMAVRVSIQESREITYVGVPPLRNDIPDESVPESNSIAIIEQPTASSAFIQFYPSFEEQTVSSSQGLAGQFVVQYNVDREQDAGDVLVVNGYFVHFFAPAGFEAFPKDVLFVLDKSGSMVGRKITQLKEAMEAILDSLHEGDRINILTFSRSTALWKQRMIEATLENVREARAYVNNIHARGGTNIDAALLQGISLLKSLEDTDGRSQAIVFLTDGQPTYGETNRDRLITKVLQANDIRIPIFSLGFGKAADFDFVKQVALQNSGFGRKIYEASDAALQIADFYNEVSTTLLQNITFRYIGEENEEAATETTICTFKSYFEGSELVVAGRLRQPDQRTVTVQIDSNSVEGNIILTTDTGVELPDFGEEANLTHIADFGKITEKMWAYLTIKQTLGKAEASTDPAEEQLLKKKALDLSLQYHFVTEMTSMVVTKPAEMTSENATLEMVDISEDADMSPPRGSGAMSVQRSFRQPGLASGISHVRRYSQGMTSFNYNPRQDLGVVPNKIVDISSMNYMPIMHTPWRRTQGGAVHVQLPAETDPSIRRTPGKKRRKKKSHQTSSSRWIPMKRRRKNKKSKKNSRRRKYRLSECLDSPLYYVYDKDYLAFSLRTKFPGLEEPLCLQIQDRLNVLNAGNVTNLLLLLSTTDCRVLAEPRKNESGTSIVEFTAILVQCSNHRIYIQPGSVTYNISGPSESATVTWDGSVAVGFARRGLSFSMTEFYIELGLEGVSFRVEKESAKLGVNIDMADVSLTEQSHGLLGHLVRRRVNTLKQKTKKGVKIAQMRLEGSLLHNSRPFLSKLTDTASLPAATGRSQCWWIFRFQDRFVGNLADYLV